MKRLNGAGTRALTAARAFTVAQRTIALIGVAVLVLGGVALANWMGRPTYQPLFTGLSGSDAAAIQAQLDTDKVPYEWADGGSTILVPADKVNQERVAAAAAGLPSSANGGYSLLDDMGVTASEFQQNVTYKRAIEGELSKTIESIDGVSSASVQLAIPEQTVFSDEEKDPTASVFVDVTAPLGRDAVGAIVHLVSAAYPGLTDANVSIVDQKGTTLSAVGGAAAGSAAAEASDYETRIRASVQAMLDKVLGPGNSTVTVAADVSSSTGTTTSEIYTSPEDAPVLSESVNDQSYAGAGAGAGAAAGGLLGADTTSNGTGGASAASGTGDGSGGNTFSQKQGVKNNAVNKTTTEQTITPGTLNRQSIAVAVNASVAGQISQTALQKMVSDAAGVNPQRGDTISVTSIAFSTEAQKAAAKALEASDSAQSADQMTEIITTAIKVVGGLVLFVLVVGLLRKLFKRPEQQPFDAGTINIVPAPAPGEPAFGGGYHPTQLGAAAPTAVLSTHPYGGMPTAALPTSVDPEFAQLRADVDALAGGDPAQTAEYLRALMGERARA